jgi:hypothetical protein
MMNYEVKLLAEARRAVAVYPEHQCEIIECYQLAQCEIEEGESAAHEFGLFMSSLNEIRKEIHPG